MNKLKFYREQQGLIQDELAARARVSRKTISEIENGDYKPNVKTLEKLARALNVDVSELLETTK